MTNEDEQELVDSQFIDRITMKCNKYRDAVKKDKGKKEVMIQKLCADFGENVSLRIESSKYEIENNVDIDTIINHNNNNNNNHNHNN